MSEAKSRSAEERLGEVRANIARAAKAAKRDPADISLIAVSKRHPAEAVRAMIDAGQRIFGESRVQEAAEKWPAIRDAHPDVELHMIGRLQSNKADEAADLFDVIHSLDRPSLLKALAKAFNRTGRALPCFVQVGIGEEQQKGGCPIDALGDFLGNVREREIPVAGLMCIPPLGKEPAPYFALLGELAARHGVEGLSMGMSGDYETAVALGASHVRVGTALFGERS